MKPAHRPLFTPWGEALDSEHPLPEYPRPQLRRDSYLNLNGRWEYAFRGSERRADGSGTDRSWCRSPRRRCCPGSAQLQPGEFLHYRRTFGCRRRVPTHGRGSCCTSARSTSGAGCGSTARRSASTTAATCRSRFDITDALASTARTTCTWWCATPPTPGAVRAASRDCARAGSGTPPSPGSGRRCGWSRSRAIHVTHVAPRSAPRSAWTITVEVDGASHGAVPGRGTGRWRRQRGRRCVGLPGSRLSIPVPDARTCGRPRTRSCTTCG